MASVKPSKQYAMKVVPYRPYRRFFKYLAVLLFVSLAVGASFFVGQYYAAGLPIVVSDEGKLQLKYNERVAEALKLSQQVANLKLAAEVDRKANEKVRAEVVELKTKVAEIEQENAFYLSVLQPAPGDKGIILDAPVIISTDTPNEYKYNIIVKQIVAKHRQVSGHIQFDLLGMKDNTFQKIPLKDVSEAISDDKIKVKFKYFWKIQGKMLLPEGFIPERIEVRVAIQKPQKSLIDKKFGWLVKES